MTHRIDWPTFKACFGTKDVHVDHDWMSRNPHDLSCVLGLAAAFRPTRLVEFGVHRGQTANAIRGVLGDSVVRYVGLDVPADWQTTLECQRREVPRVGEAGRFALDWPEFRLLLGDSLKATAAEIGPVDFAFVDGSHDDEHVRSDSALAAACGARVIVWHDYVVGANCDQAVGVKRFVDEHVPNAVAVDGTACAFEVRR